MTSNNAVIKNLSKKRKMFLFGVISVFALVLFLNIHKVYAYYHDSFALPIIANQVGDFDLGTGDINMMIYREDDNGNFIRVYTIPYYYIFNDELTSCTIPCNDGLGNCEYSFDSVNNNFSLTSNQKVTCKFYFEKEASADIEVFILLEDSNADSTYTYNSKNYSIKNVIPAYGYEYTEHYTCDNGSTLTYNSETKKVSVASSNKDTCYVYFDQVAAADIVVNTYVQDEFNSVTYTQVESIPSNKIYILNETKSVCTPVESNGIAGIVSYVDGYINVEATGPQVCDVYLDLESN